MNQVLGHIPAAFVGFFREAEATGDREAAKSHSWPFVGYRPQGASVGGADGVCPVQVWRLLEPGALVGGRRVSELRERANLPFSTFCSIQTLNGFDDVHPHW